MKVYVVTVKYFHGGTEIIGVFATDDLANDVCKDYEGRKCIFTSVEPFYLIGDNNE